MAKRECIDCEWCKCLSDSDGNFIYFCMDTEGGNYLGETGLCGWCGEDDDAEFLEFEYEEELF